MSTVSGLIENIAVSEIRESRYPLPNRYSEFLTDRQDQKIVLTDKLKILRESIPTRIKSAIDRISLLQLIYLNDTKGWILKLNFNTNKEKQVKKV